ncbi:hypothetical protein A3A76_00100 [Candidatus Woesebacteria bacterium RIFCSPLOWO2_01_FULL_39_23]|uniref:Fibronectin type-III domain-containing protein n=1 Tax=Candidatus Woesebacteria bacterium RIFCSPHIGHO2_01_FULL_40_22 TaxID=1802499 RepID=A0A1F7YG12_9BACT|nr:MAG: hypothetical protein A2628_03720 [Candidatus Woesebacteria bacterium RIFCSPHIGHO2_01_FULL_40_22]OGM36651.1 MAG: hypothetical protein A3E41_01945 [Candidatus Woesebacteria bacterium RIFCSPHIGHO2_12_FULL_38_9]OGM62839.1 MAG: hypothetical protein A3A76_00100 [Candidatus Woesebacteria bacterium RIFCSPLOWO2_01_FULL_39_23]
MKKIFFLVATLLPVLLFIRSISTTWATVSSCSATVSPTEVNPDDYLQFTITINNTDSVNINWFRITTPHASLDPGTIMSNWSRSVSGNVVTFTGNSLTPGTNTAPRFETIIPSSLTGFSGSWSVQVSDDPGGASPYNCAGTLNFNVTGAAPDTTAPQILEISVSGVTTSQATVGWTTNEAATSKVEYDVSANPADYTFSKVDTALVTSHSQTITQSVAPGTTYYYQVCSTDAANNQGCSSENSFTTAAAGTVVATSTPVPSSTSTTSVITATPTPTPVIIRDTVAPRVIITTEITGSVTAAGKIEGSASDNEDVASIDYSTDDGVNWLPVEVVEDLGSKSTEYSFVPFIFDDGNYKIKVRAIDSAGNVGISTALDLVIDRLPPRVGGNLLSLGPQPLLPDKNGVIITLKGLEIKITLTAVGGPTSIDLIAHSVGSGREEKMFSLSQSPETGLWHGVINLPDTGTYDLSTHAADGAGNITDRELGRVVAVEEGHVRDENKKMVTKGEVAIYIQDQLTESWSLWDARTFGQENPQKLDDNGNYQYFLPPGKYYLEIRSPFYNKLTSKIFKLDAGTPLNSDFVLQKGGGLNLFGLRIGFADLFSKKADVVLKSVKSSAGVGKLIGKEAKNFNLPTIEDNKFSLNTKRGGSFILSFVNTWSPPSTEQISILDDLISDDLFAGGILVSEETKSKVRIFQKKGKYESDFIVDTDGELVEDYAVSSLPMHFLIDRRGVVKEIVTGVLNKDEMQQLLEEGGET